MSQISRRIFLQVGGAAALVPQAGQAAAPAAAPAPGGPGAPAGTAPQGYFFFTQPEAAFVEAAVDRLIPPDALGPGARDAGVPQYIDRQLAGAWGAGERLYRSGPWQPGTPSQGYQLPFTPAELFRNALRGIAHDPQLGGKPFEQQDGPAQDAYLTKLQNGTQDLEGVPAKTFFESLWAMTVEGYFSDPVYGGNVGMGAWAMLGFPGAYGNYYELVDRHGLAFNAPPRSLGQDGSAHVQAMGPDMGMATGHAAPKGRR
ncbi:MULTISPECIES: gluconate 2-dehydrogenase subunit 3 family protein [Ramlibacter]|uniref:Gluconate 2-dehydrogenase subunit 3 family protein n=1 Tax=Ramlibacter aquaticus TaxID=2780094 RepID=A0ABR9SKP5_9BURK|nr:MULTISPECIES: gluconate 2-dehydrogenase subunit 3 family protein [Ramlibacter]MBE7942719.1 gluconate 2-dehydrogenase subunit 3 family protein [Ramlibacter aquaticus]